MSKSLPFFLLAAAAAVASLAACGSDEGTDNGGQIIAGGQGGGGGSAGAVGTSGSAGSNAGTGGASTGTGTLGGRCDADANCAAGLVCLNTTSTTLGGAPPGGLCTAECAEHTECEAFSPGAWCVTFESGGYCLEGCAPDEAPPKCHDRPEFVCRDLSTVPGTQACATSAECTVPGDVCANGVCVTPLTGCVPLCGSDSDCEQGLYCNYVSGFCEATPPTGKAFGAACDPGPTAPVDECLGFCLESYDDPLVGSCSGACNLAHPFACGYAGTPPADAACLLPTLLAGDTAEAGDLGLCAQLCDCNSDCTTAGEYCEPWTAAVAADYQLIFERDGYCFPIITGGTFTPADSLDCGVSVGGAANVPEGGAGGEVSAGGAGGAG